MSLRTGAEVARTESLIINPNNLKIEGFYCLDKFSGEKLVLLAQDIREFALEGLVVNDHDVLTEPEDLIRLKDIMEIDFQLPGKLAITENKQKLGKIGDFAADRDSLYIQKLYVNQSVIKHITGGQVSIDRTQIVETTPDRIIVRDPTIPAPAGIQAAAPAG